MIFPHVIGQRQPRSSYVILTIENSWAKSFEGKETDYWITAIDSIRPGASLKIFCPLLLDGLSKYNVDNCCKGVEIDPYNIPVTDTALLSERYYKETHSLKNLILKSRKRIQQVTKSWPLVSNRQTLNIYFTVVRGEFCKSTFSRMAQFRTGYLGAVFIPLTDFGADSVTITRIQLRQLSNMDFDKIQPVR